jgi:DNA-binding HxlR family transcriptional regulator
MKITNYQALILLELEDTEPENGLWRPDLAETINTATTTLHDNLIRLKNKKLVDRYEENNGKKGRNRVYWHATELGRKAIIVIQRGMK